MKLLSKLSKVFKKNDKSVVSLTDDDDWWLGDLSSFNKAEDRLPSRASLPEYNNYLYNNRSAFKSPTEIIADNVERSPERPAKLKKRTSTVDDNTLASIYGDAYRSIPSLAAFDNPHDRAPPSSTSNFSFYGPRFGASNPTPPQRASYPFPRTESTANIDTSTERRRTFERYERFTAAENENNFLASIYGEASFPLYGSRFGIAHESTAAIPAQRLEQATGTKSTGSRLSKPMPSKEFLVSRKPVISSVTSPGPKSCVGCTEDFSASVSRPTRIGRDCDHEPTLCTGCISNSIRVQLESKMWNQIRCPECPKLLIYDDVKRLADRATFDRYESLSFRSAMSQDENFVWCLNCPFGQLHENGASEPIVRCDRCGFRFCFVHSVAWHERFTCKEYDEMLRNPDGFQSQRDRENKDVEAAQKLQEEEDERLAWEISNSDKRAEQDRQQTRRRHEEEQKRKAAQAAQAAAQQRAEAERKRVKELKRKQEEQERKKRADEIKRRRDEENLSMQTVQQTTKPCPGCRRPIEKNEGCDHMTCLKCKAQFCWQCLNDYKAILKHGNSRHKENCQFHTANL